MSINPLTKLKYRLSAAIDWRVKQEFETERDVIMQISKNITDVSAITADQLSALTRLVEDLDRRLKAIENSK